MQQTTSGAAAAESIQVLTVLSQQGGRVGGLLGSAGAAEAIVTTALARSDLTVFGTPK